MNRRFTQVALAAAAAMTLSLAAPVAANASDSGAIAGKRGAMPDAARPVTVAPAAASGALRITAGAVITKRTTVSAPVRANVSGASLWDMYADVFVNGVARSRSTLVATSRQPNGGVSWPRSSGYGNLQLKNVRVQTGPTTFDALPDSNAVKIRRGFDSRLQMKFVKRGSKMTVRASKWRVYQPNGSMASVRKVKLQRLKGGKWRNFKTIKVNKSGNGKVGFKSKKKYKYRLVYSTTTTIQGARTYASYKV